VKDKKKKSAKRAAIDDHANQMTFVGLTVYDCCILGCMLLNISTKGTIGAFETMGISLAESYFGMQSSKAGAIVGTCGTFGVIALLSMGHLSQIFTDIQLICGGMLVMCAGMTGLVFLDEDQNNPSWEYMLAMFMMYSVGYPIGHTALIGLFSKSKFLFLSMRFDVDARLELKAYHHLFFFFLFSGRIVHDLLISTRQLSGDALRAHYWVGSHLQGH
jgi:ceroid-lipofuscinosis MFS transporter 7